MVQNALLLLSLMSATVRIAGELVSTVLQHIVRKVCQQLLQLKQKKHYSFLRMLFKRTHTSPTQRDRDRQNQPLAQNPVLLPARKSSQHWNSQRDLDHRMLNRLEYQQIDFLANSC